MSDGDGGGRDFDAIDDAPLRDVEIKELRLLLEEDRARRRFVRKLKFWGWGLTTGATALVAGKQIGFLDWIAGLIIRGRS